MEREYDEEEVEAILERALARQNEKKLGLTREELAAIAKEVGIDPGAVREAALELEEEQEQQESARAVEQRRQRRTRRERLSFLRMLLSSLALVAGLFAIDFFTGPGWWAQWAALGFGVLLLLRGTRLLVPRTEEEEEALDRRERAQEERRAEALEAREERKARRLAKKRAREEERRQKAQRDRERQRRRRRQKETAARFERAVETGVSALLHAAAKKLEEVAEESARAREETPPDTDFGRYVAAQKRRERGEPAEPMARREPEETPAPHPKVRVESTFEEEAAEEEEVSSSNRSHRRRRP